MRADETAINRLIVLDFVELFYCQRQVRAAFEKHVGEPYLQHNPTIPDGREAAIAALEPKFNTPQARFAVQRVLVDGNLAAVHVHARLSPESRGGAVVDLFRMAGGKIVEHWDVLQAVPDGAVNPRGMF